MRHIATITFLFLLTFKTAYSQNSSVEKSIFTFQTGLGTWISNESRLSNSIALRSEFGLNGIFWSESVYNTTAGYKLLPVITLEPRCYYNINSRFKKNRNTANNSGDFFTLALSFYPDWFVISNIENANIIKQVTLIPKWGIRRNFGRNSNFNYEASGGIGYAYHFSNKYLATNGGDPIVVLNIRLGCSFKNSKKG